MSTHAWRRQPKSDALTRLLNTLAPGSRLIQVRRLRGGLEAGMFSVSYTDSNGSPGRIVVRQTSDYDEGAAERAQREFITMSLVHSAGVPVAEPILLDLDGSLLGTPAIVMAHAGSVDMRPSDPAMWATAQAEAMLHLHTITPNSLDLSYLQRFDHETVAQELREGLRPQSAADSLASRVLETLLQHLGRLDWLEPCLLHTDFWPGNVLWRDGRVSAIIDWSGAKVGDRRLDVSQCRIELALLHGPDVARNFLDAYEKGLGWRLEDVWFFDLFLGLRPLARFEDWWLPAYQDFGLQITSNDLEQRSREFVNLALSQAPDG